MMLLVKRLLSNSICTILDIIYIYIHISLEIWHLPISIIFSQGTVHSGHSAHVPRLESNSAIRSSWEAKAVTSAVLVEPIWGQDGWMDGWKGWRPGQGVDDMVVRSTETKRKRISDFFTWNYWPSKINYIGILISWFIDNPPINGYDFIPNTPPKQPGAVFSSLLNVNFGAKNHPKSIRTPEKLRAADPKNDDSVSKFGFSELPRIYLPN